MLRLQLSGKNQRGAADAGQQQLTPDAAQAGQDAEGHCQADRGDSSAACSWSFTVMLEKDA